MQVIYKKQLLKITFLLLSCIFSFAFKTLAQNPELNDLNLQLRAYFEPLSKPSPAKAFLYDMSAHNADRIWFVPNSPDTNRIAVWYQVYDEMHYAGYDTNLLSKKK